MDGGIAEENLAATKCHVASVLAPAVSNPNTEDEPGITSEGESEDERVPNHLASVRTLTYQATHKKLLAPVTLDPTPEHFTAQECVPSRIAKNEKELWGRRATTVNRYRKPNASSQTLSGVFLVGRFVSVGARGIPRSVVRSGWGLLSLTYTLPEPKSVKPIRLGGGACRGGARDSGGFFGSWLD